MLVWRVVGYSPHGFLHAHLYGLATRADVRKSLGFLLANGLGGARLPLPDKVYQLYLYIRGGQPSPPPMVGSTLKLDFS